MASWIGGFVLPFAAGLGFGLAVPVSLVGPSVDRPVFALFMATAMSVSAIPVIARILLDLGALGTRVGRIVLAAALADDTMGWILLGVVAGIATGDGPDAGTVALRVGAIAAFLLAAATAGPRVVGFLLRGARRIRSPYGTAFVMLAVVVGMGLATEAMGAHLVLGSFVGAVLIGRSPERDRPAEEALRQVGMGLFIPLFFAYAGLRADLTTLTGSALAVAAVGLAVACASKLVGGGLGARLGGLPRWEAAAVGVGLNARGAMGLVLASIGLSLGVVARPAYATLVVIAVATSVMAGPGLRFCLARSAREAGETGRPPEGDVRAPMLATPDPTR